jgi:hypothetical protein
MSELRDIQDHIQVCEICQRANKRVNDFCSVGKIIFFEYAQHNEPMSVTILGEAESAKIINDVKRKRREAHNN